MAVPILLWPLVVLGGGLAFGGGGPLVFAAALALLAGRIAVVDARMLRGSGTDPAAPSVLSGAVLAITEVHLPVNRPGPTGQVVSVLVAVGLATVLRRPDVLPVPRTPTGRRIRPVSVVAVTLGTVVLFAIWQGRSSVLPETYLMPADHQSAAPQSLAQALQARRGAAGPGHSMPTDNHPARPRNRGADVRRCR